MDEIQNKIQTELEKFKIVEKEYQNAISQKQILDSQLHETTGVKTELDLMKKDAEVFKLIGPVLVKQEPSEAKSNVEKRLSYINGELKRVEDQISSLDQKQEYHKERLSKMQTQYQQEAAKIANKT